MTDDELLDSLEAKLQLVRDRLTPCADVLLSAFA